MASAAMKPHATACADPLAPPDGAASGPIDLGMILRELQGVADYVMRIKQEIGALRANELYRSRIPVAHDELGNVVNATQSATNTIMAAAEEILGSAEEDFEAYRTLVQTKVMEIFEACSFQDITGQRISKVSEQLAQVEKRLSRFAAAVNARDVAVQLDADEARREARKQELILHGPQGEGEGVSQNDIDALFD
ncbi:protein phosphatase CheZ [Salinarimonas sp.]|uniref:protein phosphatase CheZ n=1 Tax=Salinarimonas sp. TaxID=2766526 RepID=UPI00391B6CA3